MAAPVEPVCRAVHPQVLPELKQLGLVLSLGDIQFKVTLQWGEH